MIGGIPFAMQIASLHRYPIKGCRGQFITTADIDAYGVVGDRRLMLVDAAHRFLSQRELPRMARLAPEVDGPMLSVRTEGARPFSLELDPAGKQVEVQIWHDRVIAHDQGDLAAAWFAAVLGVDCRLVMFGPASRREIDLEWSVRPGAETSFVDGYPLLVVVEASLDSLNGELAVPVPMGRFRPSVVVRGAQAWSEAGWTTIQLGGLVADAVKPCARCLVPTTDQFSGERDPDQEPLRTLARLRTIPGRGAIFGQNLMPRTTGRITVGDPVTLLA